MIALSALTVACSNGEENRSMSDAGSTDDASERTTGGSSSGTGGRASSGGTAGAPSSGGSSGAGGSAGAGGSVLDASPDAPSGPVVTVENGNYAVFQSRDGEVLYQSPTPASYPLATGGRVTLSSYPAVTIFDVPAGSTIRLPEEPAEPQAASRQSIRIDLGEWKAGYPIRVNTGCSSAMSAGEHVLAMDEACLDANGGELWIDTWSSGDGAYINVKDIALGAASEPPLDVALPAWTPFTTLPHFTLDEYLDEWNPGVAIYVQRGVRWLMSGGGGFARQSDGSGAMDFNAIYDGIGTVWGLGLSQFRDDATDFADRTLTRSNERVGYPLPNQAFVRSALLPPPEGITVSGDTPPVISWTLASGWTLAGADRILVEVGDPNGAHWDLWLPPDATSVTLPDFADAGFVTPTVDLTRIEVQVEDQASIDGWEEVLGGWQINRLLNEPYSSPDSRFSRGVLLNQ